MNRTPRMAILGAGPIGLECLLRARLAGWDAELYEKGQVGENIRGWGHVRMFSPWRMNVSQAARERIGLERVDPDGLCTGLEYVSTYLEPLAATPLLSGHVHTHTEVVAVSRDALLKGEEIATRGRRRRPFRLLLRDARGERSSTAHVVVDSTGTFGNHNWLGPGGIPAVGEVSADGIEYRLPDIGGRERSRFAGQRTLVVGAGHSAATAIAELERLGHGTQVVWVTRSEAARPVIEVPDDPLAERARIAAVANRLALDGNGWLERVPGVHVQHVSRSGAVLRASVGSDVAEREIEADRLLALVGYRPEPGLSRELQVQTCWATEGTYPLAAALLSVEGSVADCLTAGANLGAETLRHPEPGFFTLGMKSYGRNPNFLIQTGFKQVEDLLALLEQEA